MRTMRILLLLTACFSAGVVASDLLGRWIEPQQAATLQNAGFSETRLPSSPGPTEFVVHPVKQTEI